VGIMPHIYIMVSERVFLSRVWKDLIKKKGVF